MALAATLTITACNGASPLPVEEIPLEYATAICAVIDECAGALGAVVVHPDHCVDQYTGLYDNLIVAQWSAAIDRGTVVYDGGAARDCADAIDALGCDLATGVMPTACDEVLTGTLDLGATCSINEECAGDAYCEGDSCPMTSGLCAAAAAAGATCSEAGQCASGLTCVGGTYNMATSNSGGPCEGATGGDCPLDETCVGATDATPGTCTSIDSISTAGLDEPCAVAEGLEMLCTDGLACAVIGFDLATETVESVCREPVGSGGTCYLGFPSMCPSGEYCDANPMMTFVFEGQCMPLPSEGETCLDGGMGQQECQPGLRCARGELEALCTRPRDNGEACTGLQDCHSYTCQGGVCVAPELCAG